MQAPLWINDANITPQGLIHLSYHRIILHTSIKFCLHLHFHFYLISKFKGFFLSPNFAPQKGSQVSYFSFQLQIQGIHQRKLNDQSNYKTVHVLLSQRISIAAQIKTLLLLVFTEAPSWSHTNYTELQRSTNFSKASIFVVVKGQFWPGVVDACDKNMGF